MPVALRQQLDELADGSFVERGINVLAFGLPGTGKTHAMCAIGHQLVESGRSALFMNVGGRVLTNGELEHHQNTDKRVKKTESHIEQGRIPRRTDRIRRGQRRNLKPKPPRSKNWTLEQYGDWEQHDHQLRERILPIDEGDRRRALKQAAFRTAATKPSTDRPVQTTVDGAGKVVSVSSGLCVVEIDGVRLQCRVRSGLTAAETSFTNVVAVGDQVIMSGDGSGGGIIEQVLPRSSILARPDVFNSHRRQVMAANVDQLLIVSSWREPHFWPELVDRCVIAAQLSGLMPVVCINKIDLAEDMQELDDAILPYEMLGHLVVKTSAATGGGIDVLREILQGSTTALAGMSGTGKSSLISAVQPGLDLRVAEVGGSGEGRHTTTQATMLGLDGGGFVVDTPGVREFGLAGLRRAQLVAFYPEIASLAPGCRFSDCAHLEEPGCAVRTEWESGIVSASRYHSYRAIRDTLPE